MRRRAGTAVWGWLAILVVIAVVFELTCRVEDWVMYRMPIVSTVRSMEDLVVRDSDGMHGRPNAQFQKWIMNGLGTRGPAATVLPAEGAIRVITVGASETFGLRESANHEYPRQLEDTLNARLARMRCTGQPTLSFEVLNGAFAGMSMPTIIQDVRNRLSRLHPAVIMAYPSASAYLEEARPLPALPDSSPHPALGLMAKLHPRSLERLRDQLKGMLPEVVKSLLRKRETDAVVDAHQQSWQFTAVPPDRISAFELDLRQLVGTIRAVGAVPVLVTHANAIVGRPTIDQDKLIAWEKFYPRATGPTIVAFDSLSRIVTMRVAADSNLVVVDATRRLEAAPESAFADYVHFTDLGAANMASVIADGVLAASSVARQCSVR